MVMVVVDVALVVVVGVDADPTYFFGELWVIVCLTLVKSGVL